MRGGALRGLAIAAIVVGLLAGTVLVARAGHESTNTLAFAPVAGSPAPDGRGAGTVDFKGGGEPKTRWSSTFEFAGLQANATYTVAVQGRSGADGSPEASAFSGLCTFRADGHGNGGCWNYSFGLQRLGIAQLRLGDHNGQAVLQATRDGGGAGSIVSVPNKNSPGR